MNKIAWVVCVLIIQGFAFAAVVPATQPTVPALVEMLSDPSNDVRAKAADALVTILAADPSAAPNRHDKTFWTRRIEKTKPDMLLPDALAILLPELSIDEREKAFVMEVWTGNSGVYVYQVDDYWRVVVNLKDWENKKLIDAPELQPYGKEIWVKPDGDFTGLWVTWHVNGQKAHEIQYRNCKYDGINTAYYDDGSKCVQQHYKAGVCDGPDSGWFKSGKKMYEGQYKNDKRDGTWRHWYENGQLQTEETYKDGEQEGASTTWFENGQMQYEVHYHDGKKDGLDSTWDEQGKLIWQRTFASDELIEPK